MVAGLEDQLGAMNLAEAFHRAINTRDIARLRGLMADDHRFIDSLGNLICGGDAAADAWQAFFAMFPDYRNEVSVWVERDDEVIMLGRSECADERLSGPAYWRALSRNRKLAEWQVYADTLDNRRLLGFE